MPFLNMTDDNYVQAGTMVRTRFNLADDTAINLGSAAAGNRFHFVLSTNSTHQFMGAVRFAQDVVAITNTGCSVVGGNGVLTGTTGPDGTMNIREFNGQLYIENRVGVAMNIGVCYFGSD